MNVRRAKGIRRWQRASNTGWIATVHPESRSRTTWRRGAPSRRRRSPSSSACSAILSGETANAIALKDRKIIEVDRDNFNDYLRSIGPTVTVKPFTVDGKPVKVDPIKFEKMEDFHPDQLVTQVTQLKDLLDIRQKLNDLLAKADGNDDLVADLTKLVATL